MKYFCLFQIVLFVLLSSCANRGKPESNRNDSIPSTKDTGVNLPEKDTNQDGEIVDVDPPYESEDEDGLPKWLVSKLAGWTHQPDLETPEALHQYTFKGKTVYYITMPCCDQFNVLYNYEGDIICYPDGGITGRGDGKCPEFAQEKSGEKQIWIKK